MNCRGRVRQVLIGVVSFFNECAEELAGMILGCFYKMGVLVVGALILRTLLFGV